MAGGDPSDDLDQLLDSTPSFHPLKIWHVFKFHHLILSEFSFNLGALDDFNKLDLSSNSTSQPSSSRAKKVTMGMNSPSGPTGLGMGLPDPRAKRKGKQRVPPMPRDSVNFASEALEKLTQQTREAVRGLETVTAAGGGASVGPRGGEMGLNDEAMVEEFVKQFEELAGSQVIDIVFLGLFGKGYFINSLVDLEVHGWINSTVAEECDLCFSGCYIRQGIT
jgi:hypothetical protein